MRGNPHFPEHSTTAPGSLIPGESNIQIFDSHDSSDQESAQQTPETTCNSGNLILVCCVLAWPQLYAAITTPMSFHKQADIDFLYSLQ